ncbi:Uncharacterised protein [Actinomyces bovis]|uniref:Uncharacterized protein n=1 Tax=Actinomyces bovis TaxID=1658 RepID=A0ABY1VR59_9ACTO|nr:Uncharacterised protein [Actinomyces bovis]VEG56460.1 Uncharacterised protein [Actinomyces israelii]
MQEQTADLLMVVGRFFGGSRVICEDTIGVTIRKAHHEQLYR